MVVAGYAYDCLWGNDRLSAVYTVAPFTAQLYIADNLHLPTAPLQERRQFSYVGQWLLEILLYLPTAPFTGTAPIQLCGTGVYSKSFFTSSTNAAVIMAMEYASSAVHPLDKSLIGEFSPRRMGP